MPCRTPRRRNKKAEALLGFSLVVFDRMFALTRETTLPPLRGTVSRK